jgi:hypothetical protein
VSGERESSLADPHGGPAATDLPIIINNIIYKKKRIKLMSPFKGTTAKPDDLGAQNLIWRHKAQ